MEWFLLILQKYRFFYCYLGDFYGNAAYVATYPYAAAYSAPYVAAAPYTTAYTAAYNAPVLV